MSVPNVDTGGNFVNDSSVYSNNPTLTNSASMPTVADWEAIFGPEARNLKMDQQRNVSVKAFMPEIL